MYYFMCTYICLTPYKLTFCFLSLSELLRASCKYNLNFGNQMGALGEKANA